MRDTQFFAYWGGDRKNDVTGTAKGFRKDQQPLKTRGYPYFLCYEMEVASLLNTSLVSGCEQKLFRLNFSSSKGGLSETLKVLLQLFCYKKHTKNGFCVAIYREV